MFSRKSILILFAFYIQFVFSQKELNTWYFGNQAGINFNTSPPVALTNSAMIGVDNTGCYSDNNGNILFYCDGVTIYDRSHNVMQNGAGLLGNNSGGHTATIIKSPGQSNIYYLFTLDAWAGANGLRYNMIDMSLNNGLGGVILGQKNIILLSSSSEQCLPVLHSNGTDIWVVTHPWQSNQFYSYLITSTGINSTPFVSTVGVFRGNDPYNAAGQITINKNNNKIALSYFNQNLTELFDFDNTTGKLSNLISLPNIISSWGCEFSPDGTKLYTSQWRYSDIYQYDLSIYNASNINSSKVLVGNVTGPGSPYFAGYISIAPDNKIYIASFDDSYLGVINNPNLPGTACNLVDNGFYLGGKTSSAGLVNKTVFSNCTKPAFNLGNDTTICPGTSITISSNITGTIWSTGVTSPSINLSLPGIYWASASNACGTFIDTIIINIDTIPSLPSINDSIVCNNLPINLTSNWSDIKWSDGTTNNTFGVSNSGNYWIDYYWNNNLCYLRDNFTISFIDTPYFDLGSDTTICPGTSITISSNMTGTIWSTGVTSPSINLSLPGFYWASASNACGTFIDTIIINIDTIPSLPSINDSIVCNNLPINLTSNWSDIKWSDGTTNNTFGVSNSGNYWIDYYWNNNLCYLRDNFTISFIDTPYFDLGSDISTCSAKPINLPINFTENNYNWYWQDNSTDTFYIPKEDGWIKLTAYNQCGKYTDSLYYSLLKNDCVIAFPTAFTPNEDNKNDTFNIVSSCEINNFNLTIYNQWGEKVFESNDIDFGWDGKFMGKNQPIGIYIVFCNYYDDCIQKYIYKKGSFTLIK